MKVRYSFSLIVCYKPGTLARIALFLERKGYQVETMEVKYYTNDELREIHLVVKGDNEKFAWLKRQVEKLAEVQSVKLSEIVASESHSEKKLLLHKV